MLIFIQGLSVPILPRRGAAALSLRAPAGRKSRLGRGPGGVGRKTSGGPGAKQAAGRAQKSAGAGRAQKSAGAGRAQNRPGPASAKDEICLLKIF